MERRNRSEAHFSVIEHFLRNGPQEAAQSRVAINKATRIPLVYIHAATDRLISSGLLRVQRPTLTTKVIDVNPKHRDILRTLFNLRRSKN